MCFVRCPATDSSKNLTWTCHFVYQPSLTFPDPCIWIPRTNQLVLLSPLRRTTLLQRSRLSSPEVWIKISQCDSPSQLPIPQYFSRDWMTKSVHEGVDFVNVFLSSKSQCSFRFPNQVSRYTLQRTKIECTRFTHSLGQILLGFCKIYLS